MVSLNQIVSRIEGIADQHYMVKSFASGDISQLSLKDTDNDLLYPRVFLNRLGASSTGGALYFNFELIVIDLVQKDRGNEQEVLSDTMQIAQDFVTIMERFEYINETADAFLSPAQNINYNFLSEAYSDRVGGVVANFQIKQPFTYDRCIVPITSNTGCLPAPTCTDTINSLGADYYDCVLPSYDFTTSRVQNAVTAQQQTDLIAWLCVGGSDATVNVNNLLFNTVASGGTLNVPVIDSSGVAVGTISGGNVNISDSVVSNSDVSYSVNVQSEDNLVLPDITNIDAAGTNRVTPAQTVFDARDYLNYSAVFNGLSANYLEQSNSVFKFGDADFSVGYYVKPFDTNNAGHIGIWQPTGNNRSWAFLVTANKIRFKQSSDGTGATVTNLDSVAPVSAGTVYFVVGTYNATSNTMSLYVNLATAVTSTHNNGAYSSTTGNTQVGTLQNESNLLGSLDEAFVYNKELSGAEVTALDGLRYSDLTAGQKTNLVEWWGMDELPGSTRIGLHGGYNLTELGNVNTGISLV